LRSPLYGRPIEEDRSCVQCGYNLRGLTTDARCPECGIPITRKSSRNAVDFCDLPPSTIRKFSLGFYFAAATLTGILFLLIGGRFISWSAEVYAGTITLLSFLWFFAVWSMTAPLDIPADQRWGRPWELKLRPWARWLQLGWFVHMSIMWLYIAVQPSGSALNALAAVNLVAQLAGVAGIVMLCLLLANLASWVNDDFAERCFNFAFGGVVILSPVLFILTPLLVASIGPIIFFFAILLWLVWLGSLGAFPLGMWSLARSMSWAVYHSKDRINKSRELAEKLAPQPRTPALHLNAPSELPIPVDTDGSHHDIKHDVSRSKGKHAPREGMRRDRYDHERGDAHQKPGEAHPPDMF